MKLGDIQDSRGLCRVMGLWGYVGFVIYEF